MPPSRKATQGKIRRDQAKRGKKSVARETARLRLAGIEIYFENLDRARDFYRDCLGLPLADELPGHHAQFHCGPAFVCLERKGAENYPSADKAVLFLEVSDLNRTIARIGPQRILRHEANPNGRRVAWAVLHDPEGHNILLLEKKSARQRP